MDSVAINGTLRTGTGKKSSKAVRKEGNVPCVIYGGADVVHFTAPSKTFKSIVYTPDFMIVNITVDGKEHKCILKSTAFHPVSDELIHVDFLQLVPGSKIKVALPVRFRGTAPGVKVGGKMNQKLHRVLVKTNADNLIKELTADISHLQLGQSIRVRDIEVPEGMEIVNPMAIPVATIEIPRALRAAEAAAAAAADKAAPKKK